MHQFISFILICLGQAGVTTGIHKYRSIWKISFNYEVLSIISFFTILIILEFYYWRLENYQIPIESNSFVKKITIEEFKKRIG